MKYLPLLVLAFMFSACGEEDDAPMTDENAIQLNASEQLFVGSWNHDSAFTRTGARINDSCWFGVHVTTYKSDRTGHHSFGNRAGCAPKANVNLAWNYDESDSTFYQEDIVNGTTQETKVLQLSDSHFVQMSSDQTIYFHSKR